MKVREYDKVKLADGRVAVVIDILEPDVAYLVEVPTPNGASRYDDFTVRHVEISEVLPDDYPMANPYG